MNLVRIERLFAELRRRRVFRAVAWYAASAWLIIQFATAVFPTLDLPAWTTRFVVVVALLGLPVTMGLAWMFEVRPERIVRRPNVYVPDSPSAWRGASFWLGMLAGVLLFGGSITAWNASVFGTPGPEIPVVAVVRFTNGSPDKLSESFVDSLHEELLNKLAGVGSIKTVSKTTVLSGEITDKSVREISQLTGATHVLEGSIAVESDNFALTIQLIDARDESHVFSDAFLAVRASEELESIKRLSRRTASALAIALGPLDWVLGGVIRSDDPRAIALFRHAEIASRYRTREDPRQLLSQAIAIDPEFVQARAMRLALTYWLDADGSDRYWQKFERERKAIEAAAPELMEVVLLRALAPLSRDDNPVQALEILSAIDAPPCSEIYMEILATALVDAGKYAEAMDVLSALVECDAALSSHLRWLAILMIEARKYDLAIGTIERYEIANGRHPSFDSLRSTAEYLRTSDVELLGRRISDRKRAWPEDSVVGWFIQIEVAQAWASGDLTRAVSLIASDHRWECVFSYGDMPRIHVGPGCDDGGMQALAELLTRPRRSTVEAFQRLVARYSLPDEPGDIYPASKLKKAFYLAALGRGAEAIAIVDQINDEKYLSDRGHETRRGIQAESALVLAWAGERKRAVDLLRALSDVPYGVHLSAVSRDPVWCPLWQYPGFIELLTEHGIELRRAPGIHCPAIPDAVLRAPS